jgi:hypothetical protein
VGVWYFVGYSSAVEKRLPGFFIQSSACMLLFVGAVVGIAMHRQSPQDGFIVAIPIISSHRANVASSYAL